MPIRKKRPAADGLNIDHVVNARVQAHDRLSKWATDAKERDEVVDLSAQALCQRIPSLTTYDALSRERRRTWVTENNRNNKKKYCSEKKKRKEKAKKDTAAYNTMDESVRYADVELPKPCERNVEYRPRARRRHHKAAPPEYEEFLKSRMEPIGEILNTKQILPDICLSKQNLVESDSKARPKPESSTQNEHKVRREKNLAYLRTGGRPEDKFWITEDESDEPQSASRDTPDKLSKAENLAHKEPQPATCYSKLLTDLDKSKLSSNDQDEGNALVSDSFMRMLEEKELIARFGQEDKGETIRSEVIKGKAGIELFRCVAKTLMYWLRLYPRVISRIPDNISTDFEPCSVYKDSTGKTLTFDISYYKKATKVFRMLSRSAKVALIKLPDDRTDADIAVLLEIVMRWSCFTKYSEAVKKELARTLRYFNIEPHRVILKEGQKGVYMYFIASGAVHTHFTVTNSETGARDMLPSRDYHAGECFGEEALFHFIERNFTATASEDSELLGVSRFDFIEAIRTVEERDRIRRLRAMQNFECFSTWTDQELGACANTSVMASYTHNQVITGLTRGPPRKLYFLNKGHCAVVRQVDMQNEPSPYIESIIRLSQGPNKGSRLRKRCPLRVAADVHYISIGDLQDGSYFGVGEDMEHNLVVSKGNAECLVVDAGNFVRSDRRTELAEMKARRESKLPTPRQMYNEYVTKRRWRKLKNQLIDDIKMRRNVPNSTQPCDVPKSLRIDPQV